MAEAGCGAALTLAGVVAGYGGGVVLDGVSLAVAPGEAVAVLGRNGAGKTTLLKTIMGLLPLREGSVAFGESRIDGQPPFVVARRGIAYVPQGREVFGALTVAQNLLLGDLRAPTPEEGLAAFPMLRTRRHEPAGRLSGGQQQQLAIARAMMAHPRLMLLDEPSEGIQPSIVAEIAAALGGVAARTGMGLILVEQNIDMALQLATRVVVLENGRVVASEDAGLYRADRRALERRLGL